MAKVERAALAFVVALVVCAACDSTSGGSGGETHWVHWLDECGTDADCGGGSLTCLCGVCTRGCQGDGDCHVGSRAATCFATASPGVVRRCGGDVASDAPGICLDVCNTNGDCRDGEECVGGKCITAEHDAAVAPPPDTGPPTPNDIAGKYTRVDAGVDFEEEVAVPEPRLRITGPDVAQLAGTWVEVEDDGSPCRVDDIGQSIGGLGYVRCATLVIDADAAGVRGSIAWQPADMSKWPSDQSHPAGPFEPAKDASRGYPEGADPAQYLALTNTMGNVSYRVLDGLFTDGRLSFWHTGYDLWRDWCALQTPFPYSREGRTGYLCVPPGANAANTDVGKLALCTTALTLGLCGDIETCSCWESDPLCKRYSICSCTATGCGVKWQDDRRFEASVDVEQGVMHARQDNGQQKEDFLMLRVSP